MLLQQKPHLFVLSKKLIYHYDKTQKLCSYFRIFSKLTFFKIVYICNAGGLSCFFSVLAAVWCILIVLIIVTIFLMMDNFNGIPDDIFSSSVNFEFSIHLVSFCPLDVSDTAEKVRVRYRKLYIKDQ